MAMVSFREARLTPLPAGHVTLIALITLQVRAGSLRTFSTVVVTGDSIMR